MRIIFLAILALGVLQTSSADCSNWQLGKKQIERDGNIDDSRRDIILKTATNFLPNSSSTESTDKILEEKGQEYANASIMTLLPSILIMILLGVSCVPVWSIFGCCENCCCKKRKYHESACLPCIIWAIWLAVFVVLIILIVAAQFFFKQFSDGVTQSVCDVDGSLGAVSEWFISLEKTVQGLGTEISGFVGEGKTTIFKSVDSLNPTIDSVNTTLSTVVNNVLASTAAITAAFAEYDLSSDIDLKIGELNEQLKKFNNQNEGGDTDYKSLIKDSKKQVGELVTDIQTQIEEFPASITPMLNNASTTVIGIRRELFNTGSIDLPAIPVLLDDGLQGATLIESVAAGTSALQTMVVLIYIPIFIAAPALLIGGMAIIAAFLKCRDNKAAAGFGLCCSKCGCFLLWMGLFATLGTSILFLVLSQVYNDSCAVFSDPVYVINSAQKNDQRLFTQLTAQIPKTNFTQNFNEEVAIATVKQCLAGSSYSGPSLAKTMGLDLGVVDTLLEQASDAVDSSDGIDLGAIDSFINKSTTEINGFQERANGYKLDSEFFARARNSCTQCTKFEETFSNFKQLENKDLQTFGAACDEACSVQPSKGCANWVESATTYPPLNTKVVNGVTKIELPNGQLIDVPKQVENVIQTDGATADSDICGMCRNRTCSMEGLALKVNGAIDEVSGNLSVLIDAIQKTNVSIKTTLGSITGEIKKVITKSADTLKETVDTVDCKIIGDVYNTIVISVCSEGLKGFTDYSWAFVYCALVGVILIVATIFLNMCVGLRPLEETGGAEKEYPDGARTYEMSHQPYADPPVHDAYIGDQPYIPNAAAMPYVPTAVPPVANAAPMTTNGDYKREAYLVHAS